ncbi:HNH endonuclease [Pedobacter miscanthi]|uniref:HNH endonuclease n=1 Tax=Pedobacter miscanthi TaxID=2259170 RepID=A0A366KME3_9SPHI|nr:HNH endonuclease signature motif containing protein [Pedobacter miscanthi]RBQ02825.1 HNH endonuclease [Pedobacter miscanthi]
MFPLRSQTPTRRLTPTRKPSKDWTKHKEDLEVDFNSSCAYCDAHEYFKHTFYEVDHFVPKDFFLKSGTLTVVDYKNLVYSCKFCNNNKSSLWITNSETIYHLNDEGFLDPCDPEYDKQFYRNKEGAIIGKTNLGKWMATRAFKFDEREHPIKLLWTLRTLKQSIEELAVILKTYPVGSEKYDEIDEKMRSYAIEYFFFEIDLREAYKS